MPDGEGRHQVAASFSSLDAESPHSSVVVVVQACASPRSLRNTSVGPDAPEQFSNYAEPAEVMDIQTCVR